MIEEEKIYTPVNWKPESEGNTPTGPTNLGIMDTGIDTLDSVKIGKAVIALLAVTDTEPEECTTGDMYYNTVNKKIYIASGTNIWGTNGLNLNKKYLYVDLTNSLLYYFDGNDFKSYGGGSGSGGGLPAGAIYAIAGETIPTNTYECNGQEVSRTEESELFRKIGTTFGSGDGSTTFNVPNISERVIVGYGGDGEFSVGNTGGEKEHKLTIEEIPSHTHNAHLSADTSTNYSGNAKWPANYVASGSSPAYIENTGGSQPHNNMPPYIVLKYVIQARRDTNINGVITDNINDENKEAVPNAKTVKDYVDNQPQTIYCKKSANMTTNNTYKKIDDWMQLTKVGNELSISNGKVVVGKNIHNVKISSKFRLNGAAGQMIFTYLLKNDSSLVGSWSINTMAGSDLTVVNETVVNVSEGDTITASIYGDGGTTVQNDATTLIVEKIN